MFENILNEAKEIKYFSLYYAQLMSMTREKKENKNINFYTT